MRDHYKIIRKIAWKKAREIENPFEPIKKKKKKKKKTDPTKVKKAVQEPVVPLVKSKSHARNTRTLSVVSGAKPPVIPETADAELEIADSLHTQKTESDFIPGCPPFLFRPMQNYTTNIENYMAEKYLDSMYLDKMFLRKIKNHLGVHSPNKEGKKRVQHMSKEGYKTLAYKQVSNFINYLSFFYHSQSNQLKYYSIRIPFHETFKFKYQII